MTIARPAAGTPRSLAWRRSARGSPVRPWGRALGPPSSSTSTRRYSATDRDRSIVPFKSGERARIEANGYTIIANIGDQDSDLAGGHALHTCKLPNPAYYIP
jgi:HAD superfamily, subfamily IIIB (Acid phosphatase)